MSLDCIQSLLGQLWHRQCTILLRATRGQWCKASHEEVQTWERHQVHGNLAQVAIQLARETQAAGDTAHGSRHQVVQVTISWGSQLQSAEANIVQCFIVQQERLIRVLHQLMETQDCLCGRKWIQKSKWTTDDREIIPNNHKSNAISSKSRCIVWFHHCVRHFWWRNHGEGLHNASSLEDKCLQGMSGSWIWWQEQKRIERTLKKRYCKWDAVWIFLTHFGDQQCAHSSTGAATKGMAKLEALQTWSRFEALSSCFWEGIPGPYQPKNVVPVNLHIDTTGGLVLWKTENKGSDF